MNVLIAKTKDECKIWKDYVVVVDVLRSATTVCQLLQAGKKDVLIFEDTATAAAFKNEHPHFEIYSELEFPAGVKHQDNSPVVAAKANAKTPALVVTTAGTKAVFAAQQACQIFMGGFCNFYTLATHLKSLSRDVLLVPSGLFGDPEDVEDFMCVSALKDFLQGFGNAENTVSDIRNTLRYMEFLKQGPKTAKEDAAIAFRVNGLPLIPTFQFVEDQPYAVCFPYGQQAPRHLTGQNPDFTPEPEVTMPSLDEASLPPAQQPQPEPEKSSTSLKITGLLKGFLNTVRKEEEELKSDLLKTFHNKPESAQSSKPVMDHVDSLLQEGTAAANVSSVKVEVAPLRVPAAGRKKKAIVLFSGGLDSTTCLYWALSKGYECEAITVTYGQRHDREVISAEFIAKKLGVKLHKLDLPFPWLKSSSLVDKGQTLPDLSLEQIEGSEIPSTYVPGRNLMFLSIAASLMDSIGANAIVAGPNAVDFSGYPDCTPAFFKAAAEAINRGTKMGVTEGVEVLAPLMNLSKTDIVRLGAKLKVPFELTWSCYAGGQKPCGHCDSCKLRAKGFAEAGIKDPAVED